MFEPNPATTNRDLKENQPVTAEQQHEVSVFSTALKTNICQLAGSTTGRMDVAVAGAREIGIPDLIRLLGPEEYTQAELERLIQTTSAEEPIENLIKMIAEVRVAFAITKDELTDASTQDFLEDRVVVTDSENQSVSVDTRQKFARALGMDENAIPQDKEQFLFWLEYTGWQLSTELAITATIFTSAERRSSTCHLETTRTQEAAECVLITAENMMRAIARAQGVQLDHIPTEKLRKTLAIEANQQNWFSFDNILHCCDQWNNESVFDKRISNVIRDLQQVFAKLLTGTAVCAVRLESSVHAVAIVGAKVENHQLLLAVANSLPSSYPRSERRPDGSAPVVWVDAYELISKVFVGDQKTVNEQMAATTKLIFAHW